MWRTGAGVAGGERRARMPREPQNLHVLREHVHVLRVATVHGEPW